VGAALTYTLLVLAAALVARGQARGTEAVPRMGVVVVLLLAPAPGIGYLTLLSGPDHTATALPVLAAWWLVEHAVARRFMPVVVALLLAWAQVGDALIAVIGALPLAVVAGWRLLRAAPPGARWWRRLLGLDGQLLLAAVVPVPLAAGLVSAVRAAGGMAGMPAALQLSPLSQLWSRAAATARGVLVDYGGYLPERHGTLPVALGVVHLVALPLVVVALGVTLFRLIRHRSTAGDDRVTPLLAVGIVANLAAYLFSTLPADLHGGREIVAVLPLGAALTGRVVGPWLRANRPGRLALAILVPVACLSFAAQAVTAAGAAGSAVGSLEASWLSPRGYTYGLGTYWTANSVTLASHGRVRVVPVAGDGSYRAAHYESRDDWYDPARHDARFLLLDTSEPVDMARIAAQFGQPVGTWRPGPKRLVLVYDHNILADLD
jgi:hypothetical protein